MRRQAFRLPFSLGTRIVRHGSRLLATPLTTMQGLLLHAYGTLPLRIASSIPCFEQRGSCFNSRSEHRRLTKGTLHTADAKVIRTQTLPTTTNSLSFILSPISRLDIFVCKSFLNCCLIILPYGASRQRWRATPSESKRWKHVWIAETLLCTCLSPSDKHVND